MKISTLFAIAAVLISLMIGYFGYNYLFTHVECMCSTLKMDAASLPCDEGTGIVTCCLNWTNDWGNWEGRRNDPSCTCRYAPRDWIVKNCAVLVRGEDHNEWVATNKSAGLKNCECKRYKNDIALPFLSSHPIIESNEINI